MFKAWKAYTFYALKFAQFVFKNCTFRFADYKIHPKQPGYPNKELKVLFSRLQQNKNSNTTHTKLIITVSTLPHNRIPGCSIVRNHLRNPDAIIPAVLPAQSGKYILSFWFPPEYLPSAQLF